jgi:hypothetical protein
VIPENWAPEAFESGAASALGEAGSPVEEVRGATGWWPGGRASGARLTRCWADPSQWSDQGPPPPGFGAQEGAFPGILAAASPVPAKSRVRANALKALAAGDGRPPQVPKRGARDQERRAGGLVRLASRRVAFLPHPYPCTSARTRARTRPPAPLGDRGCSSLNAPGRSGRGNAGARSQAKIRAAPLPNGRGRVARSATG